MECKPNEEILELINEISGKRPESHEFSDIVMNNELFYRIKSILKIRTPCNRKANENFPNIFNFTPFDRGTLAPWRVLAVGKDSDGAPP